MFAGFLKKESGEFTNKDFKKENGIIFVNRALIHLEDANRARR
jgi:hypothetical protein